MSKSPTGDGKTTIPAFNIPLKIRGDVVGTIEMFALDDEGTFPKIMFAGTLTKELQDIEALVKLLQVEGIHFGKA